MKNKQDLGSLRKSYEKGLLSDREKMQNPMNLFARWFTEAEAKPAIEEANAMSLVTQGLDGYPKARVVLLKHYDAEGFVFFTNYESEKGQAITADSRVGISFFWPVLERQVIIKGIAEKITSAASDAYFDSRPLGSRLGALASPQSQVIESRSVLEDNLNILKEKHKENDPNRPNNWGGYLVRPHEIEFWQGRPNRLHDRLRFVLSLDKQWTAQRLAP